MENGSWSEEDIDCVSAQFEGLRRGQARHEAKTILQIIDGELRQGSAFSIFRVSQNPSNRTSNIAGRRVDGGQAGVLDLGTLQWTPTSRVQVATGTFGMGHQATSSNQNVSGIHQEASSSTTGLLPAISQGLAERRQERGQAGGSQMDRAALEELARRERQK